MLLEFYVQVKPVVDQRGRTLRLTVEKYSMQKPVTAIAAGAVVIKIPLEIPLEIFEPISAETLAVGQKMVKVAAPEDPQDATLALAKELSKPAKKSG